QYTDLTCSKIFKRNHPESCKPRAYLLHCPHFSRILSLSSEKRKSAIRLSLCYNAVGEKDRALDMVKTMPEGPQWLNYYRFTLERDVGQLSQASETLLKIPTDYFQDPEELEAAVDFAKNRQDLVLLRHLVKKD
ncbi:MAG: hypothetical protein HY537_17915, partial [Deltaproteobacteria bacterium]|nr:hypothetical protein [Deltaproteobacteria bacterium]